MESAEIVPEGVPGDQIFINLVMVLFSVVETDQMLRKSFDELLILGVEDQEDQVEKKTERIDRIEEGRTGREVKERSEIAENNRRRHGEDEARSRRSEGGWRRSRGGPG